MAIESHQSHRILSFKQQQKIEQILCICTIKNIHEVFNYKAILIAAYVFTPVSISLEVEFKPEYTDLKTTEAQLITTAVESEVTLHFIKSETFSGTKIDLIVCVHMYTFMRINTQFRTHETFSHPHAHAKQVETCNIQTHSFQWKKCLP